MESTLDFGDKIDKFENLMIEQLEKHQPIYGDSWKEMSLGKLYDRLVHKMQEFDLTYNKDKLVSIANLAMLLYIRKSEEDGVKNV